MKVVVIYYSESGNTKKIAEAIQETVAKQFEVDLKKLEEISIGELTNYNLVFIGSPCHHADLVAPIKEFLEKIPNNPGYALAGFFTHASYPKGINDQYDIMYEKWVSLCDKTFNEIKENKQIDFKGYFSCMGIPTPPIEQFI
ncbi:MAG: flavodoxin family protein, partial [Candidatus Heimdallarchaeota archaeon]